MKLSALNVFNTRRRETSESMGEVVSEEVFISSSSSSSSSSSAEAEKNIYKYILGFVEMAVVKCAIELNIAEAVESHHAPVTLSQLSSALNCDPSMLYRIMRFLTSRNIFKQASTAHDAGRHQRAYVHTPLSRLLIKKSEASMAAFVMLESSPVMLAPWHNLSGRVRENGTPSFTKAHGKDVWSYAEANAEHGELINEAMACDARRGMREIVEHCREAFEGVRSVVDVGGGNGTAMRVLARACPWLKCINLDLPHVVSAVSECRGVVHVGGDMFVSVPQADAAFLMWVLHDWGDEECVEILKRCREAIREKGRVIIAEAVIEEGGGEGEELEEVGLMLDMVMMAHTNIGKERTLTEWDHVITAAGFSTFTVRHLPSPVKSLIVAFP
ncbi:acetylserotonin O-methyltransferase-like [Prosopis cineraria]|uniref:acetylserotonin O-methyltransferase-like n=1 Tax=Prosopis cineraria TaxID=364024 RepID=UPI00240ED9F1|nr:acetylserotonin O-methyltransferase-like [Prosopis cineraria]